MCRRCSSLGGSGSFGQPIPSLAPKRAAKPISLNGLHKILTNPYYAGLLPWQGAYYEGAHEPLISVDTWLRIQDVLRAHDTSGEKHRAHHHYLKGSIFCSACGSRFIFSRNTGRGGTYDYFFCNGKRFKNPRCTRPAAVLTNKTHLPTGRISIEEVIRTAIELGARPQCVMTGVSDSAPPKRHSNSIGPGPELPRRRSHRCPMIW